jgi:hypothetical protein
VLLHWRGVAATIRVHMSHSQKFVVAKVRTKIHQMRAHQQVRRHVPTKNSVVILRGMVSWPSLETPPLKMSRLPVVHCT